MDRKTILQKLPPFDGNYELIHPDQSVGDIIHEVLEAHKVFSDHYNKIALCFDADTVDQVCKNLYSFCKRNFTYDEQGEDNQMTMSPAAMIQLHRVDCKNYAGFCGGVLDGLNRLTERKIPWAYRFASYRFWDNTPHHVFVVVNPGGNEIWIDPTPGANTKNPVWQTDKKVKQMPLSRVSGVSTQRQALPVNELLNKLPDQSALYYAVQTLIKYGVMNVEAKVNDNQLEKLSRTLPPAEYSTVVDARMKVQAAAIGNFWDDLKFAALKVRFVAERNAFMLLLRMNGFGLATKLKHCIFADDAMTTHYQPGQDRIYRAWHSVGGDWGPLSDAVRAGAKNKAILGGADCHAVGNYRSAAKGTGAKVGEVVTFTMIVAACATLLPVLGKVINDVLKEKQQQTGTNYNIDPATGLPYGMPPTTAGTGNFFDGIMNFIAANPLIVVGAAFGISYLMKPKRAA